MLSEEQRAAYWKQGFLFPIDIAEPNELDHWRETLNSIRAHSEQDWQAGKIDTLRAWLQPMVSWPRVVGSVADLLGPNIAVQNVDVFIKEKSQKSRFWQRGNDHTIKPHVDTHFDQAIAEKKLTVWIPLSAASPKNGGLEYLPGSHRTLPHGLDLRPDNVSIAQEILEKLPTTNYTPVIMNPGQMALHHSRMVHASGPNRGPNERIAVAIRYETKTHSPGAPIHTPTIKLKTGNYQVSWRIVGK